ncbi:MAG TPA: hypothetical protein VKS21_09035 [Spirochaetota bacterium]|nr:hypothetical protein [Spirochaetota bacterium]
MKIDQIKIKSNLPCADACCCFLPPADYFNLCDKEINIVYKLYNYHSEKKIVYHFGDGKCPDLDFKLQLENKNAQNRLMICGRCRTTHLWSNHKNNICKNFPLNTDEGICDYQKYITPFKQQYKTYGYFFVMYYGFKLQNPQNLRQLCTDSRTYEAIMFNLKNFSDKRIRKMLIKGEPWGLIRVPRQKKVCTHLKQKQKKLQQDNTFFPV